MNTYASIRHLPGKTYTHLAVPISKVTRLLTRDIHLTIPILAKRLGVSDEYVVHIQGMNKELELKVEALMQKWVSQTKGNQRTIEVLMKTLEKLGYLYLIEEFERAYLCKFSVVTYDNDMVFWAPQNPTCRLCIENLKCINEFEQEKCTEDDGMDDGLKITKFGRESENKMEISCTQEIDEEGLDQLLGGLELEIEEKDGDGFPLDSTLMVHNLIQSAAATDSDNVQEMFKFHKIPLSVEDTKRIYESPSAPCKSKKDPLKVVVKVVKSKRPVISKKAKSQALKAAVEQLARSEKLQEYGITFSLLRNDESKSLPTKKKPGWFDWFR